jgi:hypothetical protein
VRKEYPYIIVSLLISLFIYLFYRTEKTVVNEMVISIISFKTYALLKVTVVNFLPINKIVVYSLPEGLWVFCITLTSKPYYVKLNNWRINCVFIPLIFCFSLEIFQLFHFTNGRFDFMDIAISALFWLIGNYVFNDKADKQDILASLNSKTMVCVATYCIVYLSHVVK